MSEEVIDLTEAEAGYKVTPEQRADEIRVLADDMNDQLREVIATTPGLSGECLEWVQSAFEKLTPTELMTLASLIEFNAIMGYQDKMARKFAEIIGADGE